MYEVKFRVNKLNAQQYISCYYR